jgi:hypothetical protein
VFAFGTSPRAIFDGAALLTQEGVPPANFRKTVRFDISDFGFEILLSPYDFA